MVRRGARYAKKSASLRGEVIDKRNVLADQGELRYLDSFEVTLRIGALNGVLKRGLWNQSAPYEARQNFTPESRRNQRLWSHIGGAAFRQGPYKPGY